MAMSVMLELVNSQFLALYSLNAPVMCIFTNHLKTLTILKLGPCLTDLVKTIGEDVNPYCMIPGKISCVPKVIKV